MTGLTYDSGALIGADHNDPRIWALHRRALERGVTPTIPAAVIVECFRGTAQAARLTAGCYVEPLAEPAARAAGMLLGSAHNRVEVTDATVVEGALRRGDAVVTSNRTDLVAVADAAGRRLAIIDV
jgi:hypothetical protein